ncbi:hypothetical protein [Nocardioides fonticola]|uniref:hypothetical protein n=1 Tax=Nocardioides fonticola TaxID=450363 RepID=UPI0031D2E556
MPASPRFARLLACTVASAALGLTGCDSAPSGAGPTSASPDQGAGCARPTVRDDADLVAALRSARPGDRIVLAPGRYRPISIERAGRRGAPITLCGPRTAVVRGRSVAHGYAVHLDGASHWRLSGFSVEGGQKGVVLDASDEVVLRGLRVTDTGDEAVHLRTGSSGVRVIGTTIRRTGLRMPAFGEGIYVGSAQSNWCALTACRPDRSDHAVLLGNDIAATTAEAIDVKEGTTGCLIRGNRLAVATDAVVDSVVDLKGDRCRMVGNRVRARPGVVAVRVLTVRPGWGEDNVVRGGR